MHWFERRVFQTTGSVYQTIIAHDCIHIRGYFAYIIIISFQRPFPIIGPVAAVVHKTRTEIIPGHHDRISIRLC